MWRFLCLLGQAHFASHDEVIASFAFKNKDMVEIWSSISFSTCLAPAVFQSKLSGHTQFSFSINADCIVPAFNFFNFFKCSKVKYLS